MAWKCWKSVEPLVEEPYKVAAVVKADLNEDETVGAYYNIHFLRRALGLLNDIMKAYAKFSHDDDFVVKIVMGKKTGPILLTTRVLEKAGLYVAVAPMVEKEAEEEADA